MLTHSLRLPPASIAQSWQRSMDDPRNSLRKELHKLNLAVVQVEIFWAYIPRCKEMNHQHVARSHTLSPLQRRHRARSGHPRRRVFPSELAWLADQHM